MITAFKDTIDYSGPPKRKKKKKKKKAKVPRDLNFIPPRAPIHTFFHV